jgi:hypothetical protein
MSGSIANLPEIEGFWTKVITRVIDPPATIPEKLYHINR